MARPIVLLGLSLLPASALAQDECANVLLVVDRSNSMDRVDDDATPRWDEVRAAVDFIVTTYSDGVRFGLALFPGDSETEVCPGNCEPGDVVVDVGSGTADAILAAMDASTRCQTTPLGSTLEVTRDYLPLRDPDREDYIVVVTDGADNCPLGDEVQATRDALAWGVETYVVGFDFGEVDPAAVNAIAAAGGTNEAIIASNGTALQDAFDQILGGLYRDPEFGCVGGDVDTDADADSDSDTDTDTDIGGGGDETTDEAGCGCRTAAGESPGIGFACALASLVAIARRRKGTRSPLPTP